MKGNDVLPVFCKKMARVLRRYYGIFDCSGILSFLQGATIRETRTNLGMWHGEKTQWECCLVIGLTGSGSGLEVWMKRLWLDFSSDFVDP